MLFGEQQTSDNNVLCQLEVKLNAYIQELPVLCFNSIKIDLIAIKEFLFFYLIETQPVKFTVKRNSNHTCLKTKYLMFLELTNYLTPGFSYDQFLKAYECEQTKGFFPYEWIDSLGKGHTGAKIFCTSINKPPPPAANYYLKISNVITSSLRSIAKGSMSKAAEELRNLKEQNDSAGTEPINCGVSCDGTWQKRGFSSRNGCVTVISIETGKVLDVETLSQACKQCELNEHLDKNSKEYQRWRADHIACKANFKGYTPAMEPEGVDRILKRSVELHNLGYTEYYGDGDSKSFSKVKDVYQASGFIFQKKKECIDHVQKRVGTALRKLKRENPGLGGKGKLTNATIDKLQNYYGIVNHSNMGNLAGM